MFHKATSFVSPNEQERDGRGMWHVWLREDVLLGKPEGNKPLGRPGLRWEDNIKTDLEDLRCVVWAGSIWLRIGTRGGLW